MKRRVAMNLLWCVPGVGGSEEYLVRQLIGLSEIVHPYEVHVFAPHGFSVRQPAVAAAFRVHEAPSSCTRRVQRIVLEHTWLALKTLRFDIIHHGGGSIPRIGNKRTLLTVHDVQWTQYPHYVSPVKLRYLRNVVPSSLQRATRIAVPSWFVSTTLTTFFSTSPEKIGVVRHGLESTLDASATPETELRRSLKIGSGPVLVYPAITHPHKNHSFLLDVLAEGNGAWADPSLRMVFAGSAGSADAEVREKVSRLGLTDRVIMPGRVSHADRNGLLAMADAMVFPSEYEGFGAPLIEAMHFGTPIICSDRGSIPEVVGEAGIMLPLTTNAWAHALDDVRRDRATLIAAGAARAERFTARLSAEDLVHQYGVVMST